MAKPHIKREQRFGISFWSCAADGVEGQGFTPRVAYGQWLWLRNRVRSVRISRESGR